MQTEIHTRLHGARSRFHGQANERIRENGPRGGLGTRCRLVVENAHGGRMVATGRGTEADSALAAALQRAREGIRRREERRRARARTDAGRRALRQPAPELQEAA